MLERRAMAALIVTSIATILASGLGTNLVAESDRPSVKITKYPARNIPTTPQIVEGEVLVKYKNLPAEEPKRSRAISEAGGLLTSKFGVTPVKTYPTLGIQRLKLPPGESVKNEIPRLKRFSKKIVEFVEPNYKVYALGTTPQSPPPDDPKWITGDLWGMLQIGMKMGWGVIQGGNTVIAVIDSGIDYNHQDLKLNMWTNDLELNGIPGQDDDHNGIVDDIYGANFCNGAELGDPWDDFGHGTLVAGTIAAVGNNGIDVVGVNWKAKLIAVKFLCSDGTGTIADAIAAIQYAVNMGATVLNNSWAGGGYSIALEEAIKYANRQNAVFIAAAGNSMNGNDNDKNPVYPANYAVDNVIAVAATDQNDQLWVDSHWGQNSVHIAAPGVDIESTLPGDQTLTISGTSIASPHVAGCAGLLQAQKVAKNPLSPPFLPNALKAIIMSTGDQPLDTGGNKTLAGKVVNARRLNCHNAIQSAGVTAPAAPTNLTIK